MGQSPFGPGSLQRPAFCDTFDDKGGSGARHGGGRPSGGWDAQCFCSSLWRRLSVRLQADEPYARYPQGRHFPDSKGRVRHAAA